MGPTATSASTLRMMGWTAPDGIIRAKLVVSIRNQQRGPSMAKISMIGLDLAKNVFQVHGIDEAGKVVVRRQLRRQQLEKFLAALPSGVVVGMEACSGAHHWGRVIEKLGHEARMMPAAYVKPYVKRNKTDGRDAEGVCEAMTRPTMRFVPVKSLDRQAVTVVHRTRRLLVRQRTMSANGFRSALAEFGIVAAQGLKGLRNLMQAIEDPASAIPDKARMPLRVLARQWETLNADICKLEAEIVRAAKSDEVARRLMAIPGLGPIGASAILAAVPDASVFKTARDFAAWLGLTPRQFGTGGKQRSGGISKQGDRTLRTLLTVGATSYLRVERTRGAKDPWMRDLLERRPFKVAAVAYAAKMARIIWAMLVTGEFYRTANRSRSVAAQAAA
jgi:transposase